jgi:predicted CXXCH cytochrome family protein
MRQVCGACHADSIERQDRSQTKHPPIKDGMCSSCHEPHGGDNVYFFKQPNVIDLCGTCHEWQKHSTHPIGEKVIDPRNKNLTVQCLSCHRAHGTEHKYMIYASPINELCTQCHVKFQR